MKKARRVTGNDVTQAGGLIALIDKLVDQAKTAGMAIKKGGRVCNLSGRHDKAGYNFALRSAYRDAGSRLCIVGFGDGENDIEMLQQADIACVIPRPGAAFYTRGDSSLASSSTTGTGPRGIEMPSPYRVGGTSACVRTCAAECGRHQRSCALRVPPRGKIEANQSLQSIHHSRSRSRRTATVVGASRQIRLSGAETPVHQNQGRLIP